MANNDDPYLIQADKEWNIITDEIDASRIAMRDAHRLGDEQGVRTYIRQIANLEAEQRNLYTTVNNYVNSQRQPAQPHVSRETRAARGPNEMDQQDLANMMNESRYS